MKNKSEELMWKSIWKQEIEKREIGATKKDESRKSKRRQNKPIILRSVVFQLC